MNLDDILANAPEHADYPKTVFITSAHGEEFPVEEWRAEDLALGWLFRHEGNWYAAAKKPVRAVGIVVVDAQPLRLSVEEGEVVTRDDGDRVKLSLTADEIVQVWPV